MVPTDEVVREDHGLFQGANIKADILQIDILLTYSDLGACIKQSYLENDTLQWGCGESLMKDYKIWGRVRDEGLVMIPSHLGMKTQGEGGLSGTWHMLL